MRLTLILGLAIPSPAQPPPVTTLPVPANLASATIRDILQDRLGFMWFATDSGLFRYDGYQTAVFQVDAGDPGALPSSRVLSLAEDAQGRLWVGTQQGLSRLDQATGKFVTFRYDPSGSGSLTAGAVTAVIEDRHGRLWGATAAESAGVPGGLNLLEPRGRRFRRIPLHPDDLKGVSGNRVRSIAEDGGGNVWIGTSRGLYRYDSAAGGFFRYSHDPKHPPAIGAAGVTAMLVGRDGELWLGLPEGKVVRFDSRTGAFRGYRLARSRGPAGARNRDVTALAEDGQGRIWVGTLAAGLGVLDPVSGSYQPANRFPGDRHGVRGRCIWALEITPEQVLWIGTDTGLERADLGGAVFRLSPLPGFSAGRDEGGGAPLSRAGVSGVFEDTEGVLWAAAAAEGLLRLDAGENSLRVYRSRPADPASLSDDRINAITQDDSGDIWVATESGLNRFHRRSETFERFFHDAGLETTLSADRISALAWDPAGALWAGTPSGLNRLDPVSGVVERFQHDPNQPDSLSNDSVHALYLDAGNVLWVGTDGGLNRFERATGRFLRFTPRTSRLPDGQITNVLGDSRGNLWLTTNTALLRFHPYSGIVETFSDNPRLKGLIFTPGKAWSSGDGRLSFAAKQGLLSFRPDDIRRDAIPPRPVVLRVRLLRRPDAPIDAGAPRAVDGSLAHVRLRWEDRDFTIDYVGLHYASPQQIRYAYRLDNYDPDWLRVGGQRSATYTNLDPGRYVFRVAAANRQGIWSDAGPTLTIDVLPPWWRTWWSYCLYAAFALALLYGVRAYELARFRLGNRFEAERASAEHVRHVARMKSNLYSEICHELRSPLTLALGHLDYLVTETAEERTRLRGSAARRSVRRLESLVEQMLELARSEPVAPRLRAAPVDLAAFLRPLVESTAGAADQRKVRLEFTAPDEEILVYLDAERMETAVLNLLGNALKFSHEGGAVTMEAGIHRPAGLPGGADDGGFAAAYIKVRDDGPGIPDEQLPHIFEKFYQGGTPGDLAGLGSGIGLALVKQTVDLHKGQVRVQSGEGKGAEFTILLRLGSAHLSPGEIAGGQAAVAARREPEAEAGNAAGVPAQGQRRRLLLIEDDADMGTYIREQLETSYEVLEASNGAAGLALARQYIPDLILTDLMMPELDGRRLCLLLREDPRTSHIPIIVLTGWSESEYKLSSWQAGVDDFLAKPFDPAELHARVGNLIASRDHLRQRFAESISIRPAEISASSVDREFLERVIGVVEAKMGDPDFGVERLCAQLGLSVSQMHRKLKALLGHPPARMIRMMRLDRAAALLTARAGTIAEICYQVGFSDQAHFSRAFKKQFGCAPSEYRGRPGSSPESTQA